MAIGTLSGRLAAAVRERRRLTGPPCGLLVATIALYVVVYLAVVLAIGTEDDFDEGGAVDVMSSLFLAMTCALAGANYLLRAQPRDRARWFWLLVSAGFLFLALDELLEFHENFDYWLRETWVGWSPVFRNWNDVLVISYGLVGLIAAVIFLPEVLRYPRFVELLATAFGFYLVHTGIDSLILDQSAEKNLVEESAKLFASAFFAIAMLMPLLTIAGMRRRGESPESLEAAPGEISRGRTNLERRQLASTRTTNAPGT